MDTKNYIKNKLKVLNIKFFDGKLDIDFPILIEEDLTKIGNCAEVKLKFNRTSIEYLKVNQFWIENYLLDTLLTHELIHVYQAQVLKLKTNQIIQEGNNGHGKSFYKKAKEIKEKFKIDTFDDFYTLVKEEINIFKNSFRGF